jgi:hypothetical protein
MASQVNNLTAAGQTTAQQLGNAKQVRYTFTGTYTGATGKPQGSNDGTDYVDIPGDFYREDNGAAFNGTISAANFSIVGNVGGWTYVRFDLTAISSGTITIHAGTGNNLATSPGTQTISLTYIPTTITGTSVNSLAVGANGTTNPVFNVDASASSVATGVNVVGAAAGSRVSVAAVSSGTNEGIDLDAKGTGTIRLGQTSTGNVISVRAHTFTAGAFPTASDGAALGSTTLMWSDVFLASGAVLNWNNGDVTITHAAGVLTGSVPVRSASATAPVGYATGAGGTVTQATSKSTGVTLNKVTGAITLHAAALADATTVSFTVTNSAVAAVDAVVVNHSSAGTAASYLVWADSVGAGSFKVNVRNVSGGSLGEAIVLTFAVLKGATS